MSQILDNKQRSSRASISLKKSSFVDPDFQNGFFEFSYPNGDRYVGEYCVHRSGLVWKEGIGTYFTKDGQSYRGHWYDDRLIDGGMVEITFDDGTVYEGILDKYKYKGAGCLHLPGNLKLILEFADNKPVGDVILLDDVGRPWYGRTEGDASVFHRENIYYANIPPERGTGTSRYKICSKKPNKVAVCIRKSIDMAALQERVFKKSDKLPEDYNFGDSEWYQNYINFKKKQQVIMGKLRKGMKSQLTDEEFDWCLKYEEFKERYQKLLQRKKIKMNDAVDLSMLHTFYGEEYKSSKPQYVIYPTKPENI